MVCFNFINKFDNEKINENLIEKANKWWEEWKKLLGNVLKSERDYDFLGELLALNYVLNEDMKSLKLKNYNINSLNRLKKIGTLSINEKYRVLEARLYNIDDKFPKITLSSLKNNKLSKGIIKIEYIVDLDDIDYETINLNF